MYLPFFFFQCCDNIIFSICFQFCNSWVNNPPPSFFAIIKSVICHCKCSANGKQTEEKENMFFPYLTSKSIAKKPRMYRNKISKAVSWCTLKKREQFWRKTDISTSTIELPLKGSKEVAKERSQFFQSTEETFGEKETSSKKINFKYYSSYWFGAAFILFILIKRYPNKIWPN